MGSFFAFLIAMTMLFAGVILVTRFLTGWGQLESRYRCNGRIGNDWTSTASFRWVTASFRSTRLVISVEIYPLALWLRIPFPLSLGLRAVCIPWFAVRSTGTRSGFLGKLTSIQVDGIAFPISVWGEAGVQIDGAARTSAVTATAPNNQG
jgi:hypothetical protein